LVNPPILLASTDLFCSRPAFPIYSMA